MSLIRWCLGITILSVWAALIGTALYVAMHEPASDTPAADAIVVLGAGIDGESGRPGPYFQARIARAAELHAAGVAPRVLITGGSDTLSAEAVAAEVRRAARGAGIPEAVLSVESRSLSTLQNALFTRDDLPAGAETSVVLVTHRFHQPRAWASFRWAGFSRIDMVAPDAGEPFAVTEALLWEAVKWPLNVARGAVAAGLDAADVPRSNYIAMLE